MLQMGNGTPLGHSLRVRFRLGRALGNMLQNKGRTAPAACAVPNHQDRCLQPARPPEPPRAAAASAITSRWGQRLIVQSSSWLESREARSAVGRQLSSSFSRECKVGTAQLADTEGARTTQKKGIGSRSSCHSTVHLCITCLPIR